MKSSMFRSCDQTVSAVDFSYVSLGIYSKGKGGCGSEFYLQKDTWHLGFECKRRPCIFVPKQSYFPLVLGCTQSVLCLTVKTKALLQLMEVQLLGLKPIPLYLVPGRSSLT